MDNRLFAKHLKNPEGEVGKAVGIVMNKTNEYMNKYTYESMSLFDNDEVLEIGFGNGKFIPELFVKNRNIKYTGIEISQVMLDEAKKNIPTDIEGNVKLIKTKNTDKIEFDDSSFDKICAINTIYFWDNPLKYLSEVKRVLRKGGELYLSLRSKEVMQNQDFTNYYFQLYSFEELKKMLREVGFSNITMDKQIEPNNSMLDVVIVKCS